MVVPLLEKKWFEKNGSKKIGKTGQNVTFVLATTLPDRPII